MVAMVVKNLESSVEISPIPVGAWFIVWVCGRSLSVIRGSNPARGMDIFSRECCV